MLKGKYSYETICDYILNRCSSYDNEITNLQLQKILYYVQGYFLRIFDYPAFNAQIQKWQYGPVVPEAYYDYSIFGRSKIKHIITTDTIPIEKAEQKVINKVIDKCILMSVSKLIEKTHSEEPWKNAKYLKSEITINHISEYFNDNNPLEIKF